MNLYPLGKALTYPLTRFLFKMRYEGVENIPREGGFILASNHRSNFDPLFFAHRVPQQLRFMAKVELFKNIFIGWILKSVGAFPIERGKGDTSAMDTARAIVEQGGVLVVFPEGHRSKDGVPLRPRSGVGLIAAQTGADVLPVAIYYEGRLRFRKQVVVRYGKVIRNENLGVDADSPTTIRKGAKQVMDAILALLGCSIQDAEGKPK